MILFNNTKMAGIPTFIINLKKRTDRKDNILLEFADKDEFKMSLVEACEHEIGAIGLWDTIKYIVQHLTDEKDEYILICEDDHQFTEHYSKEHFFNCITEAQEKDADILSGGISWFSCAVQVSEDLFWIQEFTGLQFIIVFKKFYHEILKAEYDSEAADHKISSLTNNKFVMFPYISVQKEFGYSDITPGNNAKGHVNNLFIKSLASIQNLKDAAMFYKTMVNRVTEESKHVTFESITIPTYIISLPERIERIEHIQKQFVDKEEFDVIIVEIVRHKIVAYSIWLTIRKIIAMAIDSDDDVIIICEDDHEFTNQYSREYLLKNIVDANAQGANILSGGIGYFSFALPITKNRFWIHSFFSTQFLIIYKNIFRKILDEPFDEKITADGILSEITGNKMVLFPFISEKKEFSCSDVTNMNNKAGVITKHFRDTTDRLEIIRRVYNKYIASYPF